MTPDILDAADSGRPGGAVDPSAKALTAANRSINTHIERVFDQPVRAVPAAFAHTNSTASRTTMTNRSALHPALTCLLETPQPTTTTAGFAVDLDMPSGGQRRSCYFGLRVAQVSQYLKPQTPELAVPHAIQSVAGAKSRSIKADVRLYARTLLLHMPDNTRVVHEDDLDAASETLTPVEQSVQRPERPRLFVRVDGNVVALEVHPAFSVGGVMDQWMSRRAAAHHYLGAALATGTYPALGPITFAGVIVLTPRSIRVAVHSPSRGLTHTLGGCEACRPFAQPKFHRLDLPADTDSESASSTQATQ